MAGDKQSQTEAPTAERRKEGRKGGSIAKSHDLTGWIGVLAATWIIPVFFRASSGRIVGLMNQSMGVMSNPTSTGAVRVLGSGLADFAKLALPLASVFLVIALFVTVSQVGFVFATKAAKPKFSRLNPVEGFKRVFSTNGPFELMKQTFKLIVVGFVGYVGITEIYKVVISANPVSLAPVIGFAGSKIMNLVRTVAVAGFLMGVLDYMMQRRRTEKSLMMSRQQIREERRKSDGDPITKRRVRTQQMKMSRMRMMAALARSDVLVVNPVHVAVALRYDSTESNAPVVMTKGGDELAARLREAALEQGIPVVEDPPLARAIYAACEIDDVIPGELYLSVARLLAYVYDLSGEKKRLGIVHRPGATFATKLAS